MLECSTFTRLPFLQHCISLHPFFLPLFHAFPLTTFIFIFVLTTSIVRHGRTWPEQIAGLIGGRDQVSLHRFSSSATEPSSLCQFESAKCAQAHAWPGFNARLFEWIQAVSKHVEFRSCMYRLGIINGLLYTYVRSNIHHSHLIPTLNLLHSLAVSNSAFRDLDTCMHACIHAYMHT